MILVKNSNISTTFQRFKAFTLAEVLIVIGVIGIVAAMTIPVLMNNFQDAELKTALKKEYSVLSQAVTSIISDHGGSLVDLIKGSSDNINNKLMADFQKYLAIIKVCPSNGTNFDVSTCWYPNGIKTLSGKVIYDSGTSTDIPNAGGMYGAAFFLKDGAYVYFNLNTWGGYSVWLDVNGFSLPNQIGKDIFYIFLELQSNSHTYNGIVNVSGGLKPGLWENAWGSFPLCKTKDINAQGWDCTFYALQDIPYPP